MSYLYTPGAADVAALALTHKQAALAAVGEAAVRFVETQATRDYTALRFAVCQFQTYDNLAREAACIQGVTR